MNSTPYTEEQFLSQLRKISSDFGQATGDSLIGGAYPIRKMQVILDNTPVGLQEKYTKEIAEFTKLCADISEISKRSNAFSQEIADITKSTIRRHNQATDVDIKFDGKYAKKFKNQI